MWLKMLISYDSINCGKTLTADEVEAEMSREFGKRIIDSVL